MRGRTGLTDRERAIANERMHIDNERVYRDALREISEIARRSLAGTGERRHRGLLDIDRTASKALREAT